MKNAAKELTVVMSSKMSFEFKYVGEFYRNLVYAVVANMIKEHQNPRLCLGTALCHGAGFEMA